MVPFRNSRHFYRRRFPFSPRIFTELDHANDRPATRSFNEHSNYRNRASFIVRMIALTKKDCSNNRTIFRNTLYVNDACKRSFYILKTLVARWLLKFSEKPVTPVAFLIRHVAISLQEVYM